MALKLIIRYFSRYRERINWEKKTNFGRSYGWFVEQGGERIGDLDYVKWDSKSQFWQ